MNRQLLQETRLLLEQQLPSDAAIRLCTEHMQSELDTMANLITLYDIEHHDRCVLLGCYWLLLQAMRTHEHLPHEPQATARAVLDGDFLQSFYLQFAMRHQCTDLISTLAPDLKLMQIRRAEGSQEGETLHMLFSSYLAKRYSRRQRSKQRLKQVTHDVI